MVLITWGDAERNDDGAKQISFGKVAETVPVYSPDGKWIVFEYFHEEIHGYPQIWIMPTEDGFKQARPLVDDGNSNAEYSWSHDSKWIAYIKRVMKKEERTHFYEKGECEVQIWKVNIETGEQVQVSHFPREYYFGDRTAWFSRGGYIAFENDADIYAIPDSGGSLYKLVDIDDRKIESIDISWLSISPDGSKFLMELHNADNFDYTNVWMVENKPVSKPIMISKGPYDGLPSWSPDSKYVSFTRGVSQAPPKCHIFVCPIDNSDKLTRITSINLAIDFAPAWSPKGDKMVFCRDLEHKKETTYSIWENFHLWEIDVPVEIAKSIKTNLSSE